MAVIKSRDNPGSAVNIVSWFLLVTTVLAIMTRMITKVAVSRKFTDDDLILLAGLVGIPTRRNLVSF